MASGGGTRTQSDVLLPSTITSHPPSSPMNTTYTFDETVGDETYLAMAESAEREELDDSDEVFMGPVTLRERVLSAKRAAAVSSEGMDWDELEREACKVVDAIDHVKVADAFEQGDALDPAEQHRRGSVRRKASSSPPDCGTSGPPIRKLSRLRDHRRSASLDSRAPPPNRVPDAAVGLLELPDPSLEPLASSTSSSDESDTPDSLPRLPSLRRAPLATTTRTVLRSIKGGNESPYKPHVENRKLQAAIDNYRMQQQSQQRHDPGFHDAEHEDDSEEMARSSSSSTTSGVYTSPTGEESVPSRCAVITPSTVTLRKSASRTRRGGRLQGKAESLDVDCPVRKLTPQNREGTFTVTRAPPLIDQAGTPVSRPHIDAPVLRAAARRANNRTGQAVAVKRTESDVQCRSTSMNRKSEIRSSASDRQIAPPRAVGRPPVPQVQRRAITMQPRPTRSSLALAERNQQRIQSRQRQDGRLNMSLSVQQDLTSCNIDGVRSLRSGGPPPPGRTLRQYQRRSHSTHAIAQQQSSSSPTTPTGETQRSQRRSVCKATFEVKPPPKAEARLKPNAPTGLPRASSGSRLRPPAPRSGFGFNNTRKVSCPVSKS